MANQNPIGSATSTLANGSPNTTYTLYDSTLLQGFSDPDGDTLKIAGLWADSGEVTDLGNGSWSFVPETNYSGNVVFDYVVFDSKGGEIQGTLSFNIIAPQTAPTGSVTISGTVQQNQTLTATNTLADSNGLGVISYSWLSNGAFVSNQSSYTLTQNDVGKNISVSASYTDGLGKLESVSSQSVTVSNVNDLPTGNVIISGAMTQGQILTASNTLQDADGLGTI
ncbi:MAG: cadherin-like domain-containing protein, partial [Methylococcaceae bacterium]